MWTYNFITLLYYGFFCEVSVWVRMHSTAISEIVPISYWFLCFLKKSDLQTAKMNCNLNLNFKFTDICETSSGEVKIAILMSDFLGGGFLINKDDGKSKILIMIRNAHNK